jgi:hypothetical protein
MALAPITLPVAYVETKDYGTGMDFSAVTFDAERVFARIILVMVDGALATIKPPRFLEVEAYASGAKVKKLNGDIKTVPALTYAALKAASDTGAVGLITTILAAVPVAEFASGT